MSGTAEKEYNYCPQCGAPLPPESRFCPRCGIRLGISQERGSLLVLIGAWFTLLMTFLIIANVYVALMISPDVTRMLLEGGYTLVASWPLPPFLIEVARIEGIVASSVYWMVLVGLVISVLVLIAKSRSFFGELTGRISGRVSPLFTVVTLFSALLLFDLIYYLILSHQGIEPFSPFSMDPSDQRLLFSMVHAVVTEEINDRMLLIGLPLAILTLSGRRSGRASKALFGGTGVGRAEMILILLSSMMFSLSHLQGWDAWKLLPTFITGLGLGWLFVRHGLYASIVLHFCFNYLTAIPLYTGLPSMDLAIGLLMILTMLVAVPFSIIYTKNGIRTAWNVLLRGSSSDTEAGKLF